MEKKFLYMALLGCTPAGRLIEQHDIFFGIAGSIKELVPAIKEFWPEANGVMHVDAWRMVTQVDGYEIKVVENIEADRISTHHLFFINLGGYRQHEFDEFHYKMLVVAANKAEAIKIAKQTAFYKHVGFKTAPSHIDDKYGIDVDDIMEINDILSDQFKNKYHLKITANTGVADQLHLGYFKLEKL